MIKKYTYGRPFPTESVVVSFESEEGMPEYGRVEIDREKGFSFSCALEAETIVYGLGEANRGINKRGYRYISNNTDIPHHHEDTYSLYAAHNFIIVASEDYILTIRRHLPLTSVIQGLTDFIFSAKERTLICM